MFFSKKGSGPNYNKVANLGRGDDFGEVIYVIPAANTDLILAAGLTDVAGMTEVELEDFWDNKSHANEPDQFEDEDALQAIAAKRQLGISESAQDVRALDPDDEHFGIRKNRRKSWARFKTFRDWEITP